MKQIQGFIILLLLLVGITTACQPIVAGDSALSTTPATLLPLANGQQSANELVTEFTVETPTAVANAMPAFTLASPTPIPTATAVPTITPLPTATPSGPTSTPTPSPTPQPTFTPPALPFTSQNEHYWLRRPIPEGDTVWTDKVYPYGGTRDGTLRPHHGVEFYVPTGTAVIAAAGGTVIVAGSDDNTIYGPHANFYGQLIVIELDTKLNGEPVYNLYGHLSEIFVSEGQHVDAEEIIAYSGATGVADGAHLHFEVRVGANDYDNTHNPILWLYPFPEQGTVVGRVAWPDTQLAHEVPITLRRIDAPAKYAATTSYANSNGRLNPDTGWQENFAFDDVVAGYYEIEIKMGSKKITDEFWVYPRQTTLVELILQ